MSQINEINNEPNPIFDIIQSLQSKLNDTPKQDNVPNIQNVTNSSSKVDLSTILNLLNKDGQNTPTEPNSILNLDLNSILKFQQILTTANQIDPRKNLLLSLKPFLRETRQKNVDTYITLLGILNVLNNLGKDSD